MTTQFSRAAVVAMASPEDAVPARRVGYWTDGARRVVVATTRAGKRLFYEVDGEVTRTNVVTAPFALL